MTLFFHKKNRRRRIKFHILSVCCAVLILSAPLFAAAKTDYKAQAQERKNLPVETNDVRGWPQGPLIGAESAILMEAETGAILYAKDIYRAEYPASTTKLLTALIAVEECAMNETVVMSREAIDCVPPDGSNIGIKAGQALSMEQALYAVLVGSANEVANAVGEHISGSMEAFAQKLTGRAAQLGCVNTHFTNASGLPDEDHYTCAYDMALIAQRFFSSELLCKMSSTPDYVFLPTELQPETISIRSHNNLLPDRTYAYPDLVGSKTGYTGAARQTLVSCAERDGLRLICVIFKEESPAQFEDTVALFDYGFDNFRKINVSQNESRYSIDHTDFFESSIDIFGSSKPILSLNQKDCVILPLTADFQDLDCALSYETDRPDVAAVLSYSYHGLPVGTATIDLALDKGSPYPFDRISDPDLADDLVEITAPGTDSNAPDEESPRREPRIIFVNIRYVLLFVIAGAVVITIILFVAAYIRSYHFSTERKDRKRRRSRRRSYRKVRASEKKKKEESFTLFRGKWKR